MDAHTALDQLATIYDHDLQPAEAAAEAMTIYLEMGERIAELDVIRASAKQILPAALAEPLAAALAAWDAGRADEALQNLQNAVDSAQMTKFS
jgi:hypothetical protein